MSNVVVTLGSVAFRDFEVPEKIGFGGMQRVAVQTLIGGGRVVDVLGDDAAEISFSGIFSGTDATQRAQGLDAARIAGVVLPLFWDAFYYNVILADFAADYEKPWWIPFALRCVLASAPPANGPDIPIATLVSNDLSFAASLLGQAGITLNGLNSPTLAGLGVAQASITAGIGSTGALLTVGVTALNNAADANTGITAMNSITANSASLAALSNMGGYVSRAAGNLVESLF